jgi:EmrB/QacA subfamily drug resistance transporter
MAISESAAVSEAAAVATPVAGGQAAEEESLAETASRRRIMLILAGVMLASLLSALDQTIVGTAMPRVIAELNGLEHYAWVFTAYMLTSTVSVPIYGKLSDIYGRRPFYMLGMVLFLAGSSLSGLSQSMDQLIMFRALQGLGAGAMLPISQAIIGDIFPPSERGKWQGLLMAVFGLATIVGPTTGGWITDNLGWRWVFYVNMPVGLIALLTAGLALPAASRRTQHRIDYRGSAVLIAGAVPMLLAFSWAGSQYAWLSPQIIGLLAWSVAMIVLFFWTEMRAPEPIIDPRFFRNNIFSVSVLATFFTAAGLFGAVLYLPLFVQGVLGDSATSSGAVLTPMMLGFMFSSIVGGQLLSRTGRYKALSLGGFAIGAFGMVLLSQMTVTATNALLIRDMIVVGLGVGVLMSLFTIVVQNAFPFKYLGEVTASLQFFRSIGGTMFAAILGSILSNNFTSSLQANMPETLRQVIPPDRLAALQNPQVLLAPEATATIQKSFAALGPQGQALFEQLILAIRTSLTSAIAELFLVGAIFMALGVVVSLFLKEIPLRTHNRTVAAATAEPALAEVPVDEVETQI